MAALALAGGVQELHEGVQDLHDDLRPMGHHALLPCACAHKTQLCLVSGTHETTRLHISSQICFLWLKGHNHANVKLKGGNCLYNLSFGISSSYNPVIGVLECQINFSPLSSVKRMLLSQLVVSVPS